MINIEDQQLIVKCLEAYYARCPKSLPDVPAAMRRDVPVTEQTDDWVEWKMIPSTLVEEDVGALEAELPFRLPPLFRAFLTTYCVLDMDFGEFFLPTLPCDDPLKDVRNNLFQTNLWNIGFARFASGSCGDPVCFDLQALTPDGDFAVVTINHDSISSEDWGYRQRVERHAAREADSFRAFFTRLCLGEETA